MASVLTAQGITLRYAQAAEPVLRDFSLNVEAGEFVAVVGGSGVGKSTLLRVLAGLARPEQGEVVLAARARDGARPRATVFQDGRLLPWRRLRENIAFGLEGLGLPRQEVEARVAEVLALTGLESLAERYPAELSGGQVQRGGIARALAVQPDVLLMDEPFSAVDALTRESLQDELLRLWQLRRKAVIFVTHDIAEAVLLADRVIVLAGKPAGIALELPIPLARPRRRGHDELAGYIERIASAL